MIECTSISFWKSNYQVTDGTMSATLNFGWRGGSIKTIESAISVEIRGWLCQTFEFSTAAGVMGKAKCLGTLRRGFELIDNFQTITISAESLLSSSRRILGADVNIVLRRTGWLGYDSVLDNSTLPFLTSAMCLWLTIHEWRVEASSG